MRRVLAWGVVLPLALLGGACEREAELEPLEAAEAVEAGEIEGAVGERMGDIEEGMEGSPAAAAAGPAHIGVRTAEPYGAYLVDVAGMPLYMFTADQQGQASNCYDQCAAAWPPVTTQGEPVAMDEGVQSDRLGTITRRDGTQQVTYGGWPLYTYVQDSPGNIQGQDMHSFGGEWYLVAPDGTRIEATAGGGS